MEKNTIEVSNVNMLRAMASSIGVLSDFEQKLNKLDGYTMLNHNSCYAIEAIIEINYCKVCRILEQYCYSKEIWEPMTIQTQ